MIGELDTLRLLEQAKNGRGLWIGLFLRPYPDDELGRAKHALASWTPQDAHVTLVHLGKGVDEAAVHVAIKAANKVASVHFREPMRAELTGVGWFWRRGNPTLVALVNGAKLFDARASLLENLRSLGSQYSDRYGFIPHVTLRGPATLQSFTQELGTEDRYGARIAGIDVWFPTVHVVCGDAKVAAS